MNRKKIVLLKYSFDILGGTEVVAIKLAKELSLYHDVYVVSIATSNKNNIQDLNNIPYYNIFEEKKRVRDIIFSGSRLLREYLLSNSIDIVLSIGVHSNAIMLLSTLFTKIKTVNCDHMTIYNNYGNKFYALQRLLGAKFASKSIVLTEENKKGYLKKYRISESKVDYIYNWIDSIQYNGFYSGNEKKLITVGRLAKEKGYDLLAQVAKRIYEKYPDWIWDVYGTGDEEIKKELEKIPNICLKGIVRGAENIFPKHSIYIMTSYFEGLPLVLLEAKQFKLPIVSFNCPTGPSDIIRNEVNGFLIDEFDVEKMVTKISQLIENKTLREEFSSKSNLDVEKFSKDIILGQWLNLIENL